MTMIGEVDYQMEQIDVVSLLEGRPTCECTLIPAMLKRDLRKSSESSERARHARRIARARDVSDNPMHCKLSVIGAHYDTRQHLSRRHTFELDSVCLQKHSVIHPSELFLH